MSNRRFLRCHVGGTMNTSEEVNRIVDVLLNVNDNQELYITKLRGEIYKFYQVDGELIQPSDIRFELLDRILTFSKNNEQTFIRNRKHIQLEFYNDDNDKFSYRDLIIHHFRTNRYSIEIRNTI